MNPFDLLTSPRLRETFFAGLLAAALVPSAARAAPLVQSGSGWELYMNQAQPFPAVSRHTFVFDGLAEAFVHPALTAVTVTAREAETDLGAGRHAIDLVLDFAGGDPFPEATMVAGLGVGVANSRVIGAPLQLTAPVALTAARVSALAGNGALLGEDILHVFQSLGQDTPWNGRMFDGYFMGMPWGGRGLRQLTMHFETLALNSVASPGTLPLLGVALALLALTGRRLCA